MIITTKHIVIFSLVFLNLFTQCQTEIPINVDLDKEDLVMYSYLNPDSVFTAFISKTTAVGEPINKGINTANVFIFDSTAKVNYALLHTKNGIYKSTFKPILNHKYKLQASALSKTCNASDSVLDIQTFKVLDTITTINQNSSHFFKINIKFLSNIKVETCYRIHCLLKQKRYIYDSLTKKLIDSNIVEKSVDLSSNERYIRNVSSYGFNPKEIIFKVQKNTLFNNKIIFGIENYFKKTKNYDNMELTIFVEKISPHYFLFIKTQSEHLKYINDPIYNPPKVYSNINNGNGILGTYTQSKQNIILK